MAVTTDADTAVHHRRPLPKLFSGVLLLGIAESMAGSYLVVFGASVLRLTPLAIGVFVSLTAVSGIAASTWLGRRYDRKPGRIPALAAAAAATIGYLLLMVTRSYALLLVIAVAFLGAGSAAFPQLFTLARRYLDQDRPAAGGGTPLLRSAWSLAWAIGPLLGAAALAWRGFSALFLATAGSYALVAVPLVLLGRMRPADRPPVSQDAGAPRPTRPVIPAVVSFALFHTAMFSGSVVLPLYVTRALGRPDGDVGLLFSVCALAEIPAALALPLLPKHTSREPLILLGLMLFAGYFTLMAAVPSWPILLAAQIARGIAIALVATLGITYFQDLLPGSTGRATTLFSNTATSGSLIAGIVAGAAAQAVGYRAALLLCATLAATAGALLTGTRVHIFVPRTLLAKTGHGDRPTPR
jgi:SET family sugar efflux transporter-like MFS transporter